MKILFAYFIEDFCYPASILASLAVRKGCEVDFGYFTPEDTEEATEKKLRHIKPDLLALSFMLYSRDEAFLIARVAKKMGIKVIAGGVHPTLCPEDLLTSGYFDGVVVGDGVGIFEDIIDNFKSLDGCLRPGKEHPEDALYFSRFFSNKQKKILKQTKTYEIFTTFGCPFHCAFCSKTFCGVRKFPLEMVMDSLTTAKCDFGIENIVIWDEVFSLNHTRLVEFRKKLNERELNLNFIVSAHTSLFRYKTAEEFNRIGVTEAWFGVETASDRLLAFLNKISSVHDAQGASKLCKECGIPFCIYLIVGLPTQIEKDYEMTVDFVRQTEPDKVIVSYFTPYPGSTLFTYCLENGYMPKNWGFERYLQADDQIAGTSEKVFSGLNNIDYDLARYYKHKIEQTVASNNKMKKIRTIPLDVNLKASQDEIGNATLAQMARKINMET